MQTAGARAVAGDDNGMSREAVLLQWERKIEAAERLEGERSESGTVARAAESDPAPRPASRRFERAKL